MSELYKRLEAIGADVDGTLERFDFDEKMYLKYVTHFPEEPTMQELVKAVEAEDYAAAEKAVHTLKGITLNIGFLSLGDNAIDMLEELRDKNVPEALRAYEKVKEKYKIYCDTIKNS